MDYEQEVDKLRAEVKALKAALVKIDMKISVDVLMSGPRFRPMGSGNVEMTAKIIREALE